MPDKDIVSGLFGLSPWQVQQQQAAAQRSWGDEAALAAGQSPGQMMARAYSNMGAGLGNIAGGMLGMENPAITEAKARESAIVGLDTTNPDAILQRAQQIGDPRLKMRLTQYAQQLKAQQQKAALEAQQASLAGRKQDFAENQAFELKKMEAEARIRQNDERIRDAKTSAEDRAVLQRENNQIKILIAQMAAAAKQGAGLGKPPIGYRYTADGNLEPVPGGPKDMTAKNKAISETAEMKAKLVSQKVDEALKETGFFSTGLTGEVLGMIPGTGAYDLDATLDTIKANLGFNELQAMRQASPTGGALGQVAVRELEMLQATIASLKKGQSQYKLRKGLNQVKTHYGNWKKAVDASAAQDGGQSATDNQPTSGWSIKKK